MKFNSAHPFFEEDDIKYILKEFSKLLAGDGLLSMGKFVSEFEEKFAAYVGSQYAIATSSGTGALETLMNASGLKEGDEVIIPAQTFIATASSVVSCGLRPVFAETNENFLLDFEDMKSRITSKTKAVILVHYGGLIDSKVFEMCSWLKDKNIFLFEDAAHSHGASLKGLKAGNIGDGAAFSFYSTKNMTTGEGGMITTNNPELANRCASIRSRGLNLKAGYEIFDELGTNQRMTEVQALMGLSQLSRLDEFVAHRNMIAQTYSIFLKPLSEKGLIRLPLSNTGNSVHANWRYVVFLLKNKNREKLREQMAIHSVNIDWAYQPLVHLQPIMKKLFNNQAGNLPLTEGLADTHFCLPIHLNISKDDAKYIGKLISEYL